MTPIVYVGTTINQYNDGPYGDCIMSNNSGDAQTTNPLPPQKNRKENKNEGEKEPWPDRSQPLRVLGGH